MSRPLSQLSVIVEGKDLLLRQGEGLVEIGQLELALSAFEGALLHHADYPDVHFHLARLLDSLDRPLAAESHWRQFLELVPHSPWSDEARERLSLRSGRFSREQGSVHGFL